jgi:maltose O-acetyltransferase
MKSFWIHLFNLVSTVAPGSGHRLRLLLLRRAGIRMARNVRMAHGVLCYGNAVSIGRDVWFSPGCRLESGYVNDGGALIVIGEQCDFGPGAALCCGSHAIGPPSRRAGKGILTPIMIGAGCWIGANAIILGGAIIGSGSVVGAGAVVLPGVYPANVLLAGNPARVKKEYPSP